MTPTAPGGSATIRGVLYQALWCLLRLSRAEIRDATRTDTGELVGATLVLEPAGGGGDTREVSAFGVVVTQLKARADLGAWSLQEVITQVLPDLLKAVRLEHAEPVYEFVTEGRVGRWREVLEFFEGLRKRERDPATLSDTAQLCVGPAVRGGAAPDSFWRQALYSEAELFEKIVVSLGGGPPGPNRREFDARVWHLLSHFRIREGVSWDWVVREIDANLAEIIDVSETVVEKRRALVAALAELAASGNVTVDIDTFLSRHGLRALRRDTEVAVIVERASAILKERLCLRGYRPAHHVQGGFTEQLARLVDESPVLVITGVSGAGKSWHGYALASMLASRGELVAHVEAAGAARQTLDEALGIIWHRAKGHDAAIPYENMAKRLPKPPPRRILFVDGLESAETARSLALIGCESLGIRLVLGAGEEAAAAIRGVVGPGCRLVNVPPLSPSEFTEYLEARRVEGWASVPGGLRDVLANPLLARLYCDTHAEGRWRPASEYELLQGYWHSRLEHGTGTNQPLDLTLLRSLGRVVLAGQVYPWPARVVHDLVRHEASLERLRRSGWLVVHPGGACSLWHDRLLNWLVAATLAEDAREGALTPAQVAEQCAACTRGLLSASGRSLRYVAMDVLWILGSAAVSREYPAAILAALEAADPSRSLYTERLPTVGSRAASGLLARLDQVLDSETPYAAIEIVKCLSLLDGDQAVATARKLLDSDSALRRTTALHIFRAHSDPESLDRLWALHVQAEGATGYQDRMDALSAAVRSRPSWLRARLSAADASTPRLEDLVYLLARQPEGANIWAEAKDRLKRVVPEGRRRCLMRCIMAFRDPDEAEFARAQRSRDGDLTRDMAMAAVARIDPEAALADLAEADLKGMAFTRGWHLHPLLAHRPRETQKAVRDRAAQQGLESQLTFLYHGAENEIDVGSFDLLLDHTEETLAVEVAGDPDANSGPLHGPLAFLDAPVRADLLDRLRARRGGSLPRLLEEYLLAIGPRSDIAARLNDRRALRLLQWIDDARSADVVLAWLNAPSLYGRFDGLEQAHRHADERVVGRLRALANTPTSDETGRFERYMAINALCRLGDWDAILKVCIRDGLAMSPYPIEFRRGAPALAGTTVDSLAASLKCGETLPGLLLAAGLARDPRNGPALRQALLDDGTARDAFLAAAISAESLGLHDEEVVTAISGRLRDSSMRERLSGLLAAIGTPPALDALMRDIEDRFDPAVCATVGRYESHARRAAALAWQCRSEAESSAALSRVLPLLARHPDPGVRLYLELMAFGHRQPALGQSVRDEAIDALGQLDPSLAYEAARGALLERRGDDRESLPALLARLDPSRARGNLLELAQSETDELVELAIADALARQPIKPEVDALLGSLDPGARRCGCVIAARREANDASLERLRGLALDQSEQVAKAAIRAVREVVRSAGISDLLDEWGQGPPQSRRAALLERIVLGAAASRDRPPARPGLLARLQGTLDPLELAWAEEVFRKGEREFQSAARERARRAAVA